MTYYLKNPSGRIVEIDDPETYKSFLKQNGFDLVEQGELDSYLSQRNVIHGKAEGVLEVEYAAPAAHNDGYGQSHRHIQDALLNYGVKIERQYHGQEIGLAYGYPEMVNKLHTPIKIIFSMFESTKIPDEWASDLEKADLIITPSKFCQKAFKDAGFDSIVIPLGYDEKTFTYQEKNPDEEPFLFLHYDAFNARKGWDIVFKAFNEEFKNENARLILKTTRTAGLPFPILRSQYPQIDVIKESYSHKEINDLLHRVHCYVIPSRGEGFGHPPLEALATGTPVIMPNAHGFAEFFTSKYFNEVKIKGDTPALYDRYKGQNVGKMVEPDVNDLRAKMRFIYEHRSYAFDQAKEGAIWARANWNYQKTGEKLSEVLKDIKNGKTSGAMVPKTAESKKVAHSIVMLTYNALKYTKGAIEAILENTPKNYELIIVDNASKDGTQKWLKEIANIDQGVPLKLVLNKENKGVAGGRNQGMAEATGDFITFLDNDTEVGRDWQKIILEEFNDPSVGVVGKGGQLVPFLKPIQFVDPVKESGRSVCDVVPGFCFTFRRDLIGIAGCMFEDFPNGKFWHEDLDFCLRVQIAGYKILSNDNIPIKHFEHKSIGDNVDNAQSVKLVAGFYENAAFIQRRLISSNIVTVYRTWEGWDKAASYDLVTYQLCRNLRKSGMVVIRKPTHHSNPPSFDLCNGFNIIYNGYRIGWLHQENDRPPENWREAMKHLDYVLAASPHLLEACKNEPYFDKIVNISPDGVNGEVFNMDVEPLADFYPGKFKFLMVGATQPRKNTENLIKWYTEVFTAKDKVVLILKDIGYGHRKETEALIRAARQKRDCPEIAYLYEDWSSEKLASVYRAVAEEGVYIHPHRAECFGLPQIEAVACGCRVGTTNWGGPKANFKDVPAVTFFGYDMAPSSFHNWKGEPYYGDGEKPEWAEPKESDVKKFMIDSVKEEYDRQVAAESSKLILDRFSYEKVAERVKEFLCTLK